MEKKDGMFEAVLCEPIQVTLSECGGDEVKMIKKFMKKVRKLELLKPYYDRLMFHETKSQKRRRKQRIAKFNALNKKDE